MPPRKQRVYKEMVEFQKELRQLSMAGSLRRIIHAQQEQINPPMPEEVARKEMANATASTIVVKAEATSTSMGLV